MGGGTTNFEGLLPNLVTVRFVNTQRTRPFTDTVIQQGSQTCGHGYDQDLGRRLHCLTKSCPKPFW